MTIPVYGIDFDASDRPDPLEEVEIWDRIHHRWRKPVDKDEARDELEAREDADEEQRDRNLNRTLSLLSALFLFPSLYLSFISAAGKFKIFGLADEAHRLAAINSLKEIDINSSWLLIMLTTIGVGLLSLLVFRLFSRTSSKAPLPKASSK